MATLTAAAARQLQKAVQSKLAPKLATETAYIVARNMIAINGQTWQCPIDGDIGQAVEVVNRGTPSRAQYEPAAGGGSVVVTGGGGTLSVSIESHQLADTNIHRGELARTQATWAFPVDGSRTLIGNISMLAGLTIDGMDPSVHVANPAAHHDPVTPGPGVIVTGQMVSIQPGTLSATTVNGAVAGGQHTHFISATSDGNATRNEILKSSQTGGLTLDSLTVREIKSTGDLDLNPAGGDVLPAGHISVDLGDINRKWRTLFAAELFVETLVAQHVMATIGGRILVAPTSKLTDAIPTGSDTYIFTAHQIFLAGDFGYMQKADGGLAQIEAVKFLDNGSLEVPGSYRYRVQRNVDGTGANTWREGDAIVNLGGAAGRGSGYIELTSTQTIHQHIGPTITIYSRPTAGTQAWNSSKPVWSAGNLESFLDYSTPTIGQAFGNDLTTHPTTGDFRGVTNDVVNGPRMWNTASAWFSGSTKVLEIDQATGLNFRRATASTGGGARSVDWWIDIDDKLGGNLEQTPAASIRQHYTTTPAGATRNYLSLWSYSLDREIAHLRLLASKTNQGVSDGEISSIDMDAWATGSSITLGAKKISFNGELSDWVDMTLALGWRHSSTSQWQPSAKRVGDMVFARGLVGRESGTGGGAPGTVVAYLPSSGGYYPARGAWYLTTVHDGTNAGWAILNLNASGQISIVYSSLANIYHMSLANMYWSTATT